MSGFLKHKYMAGIEQSSAGGNLIDGYLCWPFTTKGHYQLPSGIAPVLMDVMARYHNEVQKDRNFLCLPHSWNVNGKPITDQALEKITGVNREVLHKDEDLYFNFVANNLQDILKTASSLADANIDKSKNLMTPLGLKESGTYRSGGFEGFEFRDDGREYSAYIQRKFLEWYGSGLAYMVFDDGKPFFYLDIEKLYKEKPLKELLNGVNIDKDAIKEFKNNYHNYKQDLPISTFGGYATPIPIYVSATGNVLVPEMGTEPIDPRLSSENKNHLLVIKPLISCYLFIEYLALKFQGFAEVNIGNDYHMATRVNFVSNLLSRRCYQIMNIYLFHLLKDQGGNTFSFKKSVVQEMASLENTIKGLSRFTIIKNTKLGYGSLRLNLDKNTLSKVQKNKGLP